LRRFHGGLGGRQTGDRNAARRAGDIVQPDLVAEEDRLRIAAVLAADPDLEILASAAAPFDALLHQLADARLIDRLERIGSDDVVLGVVTDERLVIVTADAE